MRRVILAIVATAAALAFLLSFKTHSLSAGPAPASAAGGPNPADTAPGAGPGAGSPSSSGTGGAAASAPAGSGPGTTVTGKAWPTIYGPVQVKITVAGGRITAVTALVYPTGTPEDEQINAYAIPQLNSEALAAGSAKIDTVSGATYTSQGYVGSLQSALDQAKA